MNSIPETKPKVRRRCAECGELKDAVLGKQRLDAVLAKKREHLIAWLGRHRQPKHCREDRSRAIFDLLGIPGKTQAELDAVSLEKLQGAVKAMKIRYGSPAISAEGTRP